MCLQLYMQPISNNVHAQLGGKRGNLLIETVIVNIGLIQTRIVITQYGNQSKLLRSWIPDSLLNNLRSDTLVARVTDCQSVVR